MAIYSLRMTAVGKTTQKQPFTAAAHLKYITRAQAVTHVMAARMPASRRHAIAWLKREEENDRKNARVIDKLVLALPRELPVLQQRALVKAFAEEITKGRAAWFAAFHTAGKDARNPHCHLILRDRDFETGRRVMFLSAGKKEAAQRQDKGQSAPTTLARVRELWELCANTALAMAGRTERIDRRSLREQGVARRPQVHEGPNIRAMQRRGFRPASRNRVMRNAPGRRRGRAITRIVRYAEIDRGQTRAEYNDRLRQQRGATGDGSLTRSLDVDAVLKAPETRLPTPVMGPQQAREKTLTEGLTAASREHPSGPGTVGRIPPPEPTPTQRLGAGALTTRPSLRTGEDRGR